MELLITPEILTVILALVVLFTRMIVKENQENIFPALTVGGASLILVISFAFPHHLGGHEWIHKLFNSFLTPDGAFLTYSPDILSIYGSRLLLVCLIITALGSWDWLRNRSNQIPEFHVLLILATSGLMFMASSQELLTFVVSLEISSLCLYALSGYMIENRFSVEAGIKYLLIGAAFSALLLYGVVLVYGATGTTSFKSIGALSSNFNTPLQESLFMAGCALILFAFSFKLSLVPFHMWTPDIFQGAPVPIAGFLSVASKAAAFIVLLRLTTWSFPGLSASWIRLFLVLSVLSMIFGNIIAISQKQIRRLMAYSSIGQVAYLIMGIIAANHFGTAALLFFLVSYVFTNMAIFLVAGAVSHHDDQDMNDFHGLDRKNPFLALMMLLGILSLCGIPPMSGFFAKIYVFSAAIKSKYYVLVFLAMLATTVSLYYYLNVLRAMYIESPKENSPDIETGTFTGAGLWICMIGMLWFGLFPQQLVTFCTAVAQSL